MRHAIKPINLVIAGLTPLLCLTALNFYKNTVADKTPGVYESILAKKASAISCGPAETMEETISMHAPNNRKRLPINNQPADHSGSSCPHQHGTASLCEDVFKRKSLKTSIA